MSTLIYAPQIQVHIRTSHSGLIDVSEDLVNWQLNLRENAPHTFTFSLQNAQRKYDGRVLPMDTISIKLKRLNWLQAFTGFVNQVPIFQAWPGTIDMSATCTLKIPQFWYWDPTTAKSQAMMLKAFNEATVDNTDATKSSDSRSREAVQGDRGIKGLILDSMSQVMGWDTKRIHIGQIPNDWFKWSSEVAKLIGADEALYQAIGGSYTAAGSEGGVITASLPPGQYGAGQYGGMVIDEVQAKNASIIYSACKAMGIQSDSVIIMTLMCALTESSLHNWASDAIPSSQNYPNDGSPSGDHDSAGLFQQRLMYYGPIGKIMDPRSATRAFVSRLQKLLQSSNASMDTSMFGYYVQRVQGSAFPDRYQKFLGPATAMVRQLNSLNAAANKGAASPTVNGGIAGASPGNGVSIADPRQGFKASGAQVAVVGLNLIKDHTPPNGQYIRYQMGGDVPADTDSAQVTKLDCSSLIDWVYYHTTGLWLSGKKGERNTVATIQPRCVEIPLAAAKSIQGAVLTAGTHHTALSVGNGKTCVAAKTDEVPLSRQVVGNDPIDGQGFDRGWLLPEVDYAQSATSKAAMEALQSVGVNATKLGGQLTDVGDPSKTAVSGSPFLSLLNHLVLNPIDSASALGQTLGGPVALLNDEPFLPWLQALVNGTMRSFCSAPNGDFIAWFPDYFGVWGMAGKLVVEEIELQDFTVYWSDQQMVTHQFVLGNQGLGIFDQGSAGISFGDVASDLYSLATGTAGIASFDYPEIFKLIYGATAPRGYIDAFLRRFGARPDVQTMPFISRGQSEFFMALYLFIQRWAAQFTAQVPMTFMPEAFPGMLMQIPRYGFQAYIQGVTHTGSYGPGGGFTTTLDICAPSNIGGSNRNDLLALLPVGSDVKDSAPPEEKKAKKRRRS